MNNEIVVYDEKPMPIQEIKEQMKAINELYKDVMKKDEHYGLIPGTKKETLYKSGAEKLVTMFQLAVKVESEKKTDLGSDHREIEIIIGLYSKKTGNLWGQGIGSCSTKESKYRYRNAEKTCPLCDNNTIIKGKEEYGGGWLCYTKKGGCGEKWNDGAEIIEGQITGKVENPDIADVYNTVLKMAYKRALVAATISSTGVSDIFTQDMEDFLEKGNGTKPQTKPPTAQQGQPEKKPEPTKGMEEMTEKELLEMIEGYKTIKEVVEKSDEFKLVMMAFAPSVADKVKKAFQDRYTKLGGK